MIKLKKSVYADKKYVCKKYPHKYNMDMCLAKKRGKDNKSRRCRQKAIASSGRCKLHGGSAGRPITHGKYSKYFKEKFKDKYEFFRRDPKILELKDELAILRALASEAREFMDSKKFRKNGRLQFILRDQMSRLVDMVGKNIERVYKIKSAVVSIEAIPIVIKQLINIIAESISVCPHCKHELRDAQRDIYTKMTSMRLPIMEWNKQKDNKMLEAEYKLVTEP